MERILEPELMEDAQQVTAYANADFTQPHNEFIQRLANLVNPAEFAGDALDLGCGPGDISRRFLQAYPLARLDAVDGAKPMLDYGKKLTSEKLLIRLNFILGKLPTVNLPQHKYDLILSNSLLHHLPKPEILWTTITTYSQPGTKVAIMDLTRPPSTAAAKQLVARYAADEPPILQHDFYHSLLAAFTAQEIKSQLAEAQLPFDVATISDRHVFISGTIA
jgi:trans-aconitate methyltransferase